MIPISAAFFEWGALNQGMEVSPSNWKKQEIELGIAIPETAIALEKVVPTVEEINLGMAPLTEEINEPEISVIEPVAETVTEDSVDQDPWFFAPMPQKNVTKKKTSKKSSGDSGTQQLGLF
jgi:hypothetical protein